MAPAAPNLPTRFPCWCRAVYSWGGETKRDLGFIEGDLIECLNAGDGSWWMGRLRRDKRMVGLFPSNFVQVLDENFQPGSRSPSPLPQSSGSISSPAKPTPQKSKSVFRKPFQAYYNASQPNPEAAARVLQAKNGGISPSLTPQSSVSKQHRPYASMKRSSNESRPSPPISSTHNRPSSLRTSSPMPPLNSASPSRNNSYVQPASPLPPRNHSYARGVSPMPTRNESYMRTTSPMPARQDSYLRTASPMPARQDSYIRTASPMPARQDSYIRTASPMSARHDPYAHTGSPLRSRNNSYDRAASPMPIPDTPSYVRPYSRAHSPAPSFQHHSRSPSPNPYAQEPASSPPPPPPPHRVAYNPSRAPSPAPYDDYREEGYHTPEPPTHDRGFTPSPLTTAMNDVMSSLQDMGLPQSGVADHAEHTPPSIWSPEAFDQAYAASAKKHRPQTSLGIGAQEEEPQFGGSPYDVRKREPDFSNNQQGDEYFHRMESRLKKMHEQEGQRRHSAVRDDELHFDPPPPPPPKRGETFSHAPQMSVDETEAESSESRSRLRKLKNRKSAYELGREVLGRTFTTKSSVTTASSTAPSTTTQSSTSTQQTQHSLMSGISAGGFSATSAGSFARRKWALGARPASAMGPSRTPFQVQEERPETPFTGVTYHSSHASQQSGDYQDSAGGLLGGLTSPKPKKSGFFKKMKDTVKTGAANARSTIASSGQSSRPVSRQKNILSNGIAGISGPSPSGPSPSPTRDLGLANIDWVQVRRDVNRSNSLSKNERNERAERCQMMDLPVINPIDILMESAEGDESLDGLPISEPMDFTNCNLSLVDKSARFVNSLPPMTNPTSLAQGFVCRPYRSDIQRLRAIFTWVSERVAWEEDFEGDIDSRRVIQTRRGCAEEIAVLVMEMCSAVGIHAEVIRGYLKTPGEVLDLDLVARPNHWWNAVIVEGEWRIMDCCLANPSNPKRSKYSSTSGQAADGWWFLARPMEICYTHVPLLPEQQHIVPPMAHEILMALPCACPPYFKNGLRLTDFDTSVVQLEDLEQAHIHFSVPDDVECVAEVEAQAYAKDADGDFFESGDVVRKSALAQAEWVGGQKRYTIKALLPGDEGQGMLKVYAGKRGLMHSIKSNPHPLAFALPIVHHGQNPPYDFVIRHPTPHAQRHDLYVAQPQCLRLAVNNTFVFAVRQHPSSLSCPSPNLNNGGGINRTASPGPIARPTSSLSMTSASTSAYSNSSSGMPSEKKPAKLAIQSPAGKIIRLMRRSDYNTNAGSEGGDGGVWETVIKIGERGTWRGLVLADRTARWCVFAEWECF